ncbi:RadC family protein [Pseudovibrio exalbescens]|uniref:MPN domain-containing protein n=1 Tax=Pseudovibrio exalbescens TaxID=197461 RepID=A0A1U7JKJ9_9HYPH|nr:DNA repair protein RadC [Pseudovibrio exalbescens]OKL45235.1 hypothetical protein A3843_02520 [Pseudovibrio exalbescens]
MSDDLFGVSESPLSSPTQKKTTRRPREEKHYHGHRDRLRQRFDAVGADRLQNYELLELLLFSCIKQGDTKPLAKALIERFGSFAKVLAAPRDRLMEVPGCGEKTARFIKELQAAAVLYARDQVDPQTPLSSWSAVMNYIHAAMAHSQTEEFRILFLDKKNQLIADEIQQKGTVDHAPVYPREVIKRALELAASAIILVHNHPSGDPTPSRADIEMTSRINEALKPLNIVLHDHIIIAQHGHASFRGLNLL